MRAAFTSYLQDSARPWASLLFVTPLLVVYELGQWSAAVEDGYRNAADLWLRGGLQQLGLSASLLAPVVTVIILLAWHHLSRRPWSCRPHVLGGMYLESCLLAGALLVLAGCWPWQAASAAAPAPELMLSSPPWMRLVAYLGAGIYEEVFFRLLLLSALAGMCRACGASRGLAGAVSVGLSSLAFALAHYQTILPHGEVLDGATFCFRFTAGTIFGALFWQRGFGIAVGTHALYDLLVGALYE
jgi:membrane protease YdiL (CAAX protease family)